jgi:ketosteroid isomerase-like protein
MLRLPLLLPALLAAASCAAPPPPADSRAAAEPVIAAERAFAARHQQVSVKQAFAEHAAPDAVMVTPGEVRNALEFIAEWPDADDKGHIVWWPSVAGIARSGELGFTMGPASYGGGRAYTNYFTVWKKQPDGGWKWVIDMGTRKGVKPAGGPGDPVAVVPVSTAPAKPADRAWAELKAIDAAPSAAGRFAPEARAIGLEPAPLVGAEAIMASWAGRPAITTKPEGGGVSEAGDLGWTYGFATWSEAGTATRGPYLRVWQRRAHGWTILVENIHAF